MVDLLYVLFETKGKNERACFHENLYLHIRASWVGEIDIFELNTTGGALLRLDAFLGQSVDGGQLSVLDGL